MTEGIHYCSSHLSQQIPFPVLFIKISNLELSDYRRTLPMASSPLILPHKSPTLIVNHLFFPAADYCQRFPYPYSLI
ncbi:hypothetical protein GDO86_016114 [Hymenochirus boettgeri]|uniref:Uncharacterized protein n=1 Tax=Hymenochirus boettgeri TaxID=247094 RepID=A0A8T2JVR1_9PIPI|nr:hypothetical protein GDO86_016114 [Hymenochirus boettgeri]KAG8449340.1 hypothetical protein GDO86_016114 [Hymenochirus boettgeri]